MLMPTLAGFPTPAILMHSTRRVFIRIAFHCPSSSTPATRAVWRLSNTGEPPLGEHLNVHYIPITDIRVKGVSPYFKGVDSPHLKQDPEDCVLRVIARPAWRLSSSPDSPGATGSAWLAAAFMRSCDLNLGRVTLIHRPTRLVFGDAPGKPGDEAYQRTSGCGGRIRTSNLWIMSPACC